MVFEVGVAAGGIPVGLGEVNAAVGFLGAFGVGADSAEGVAEIGGRHDGLLGLGVALDDDARGDGVAAGNFFEPETDEAAVAVQGVVDRAGEVAGVLAPDFPELFGCDRVGGEDAEAVVLAVEAKAVFAGGVFGGGPEPIEAGVLDGDDGGLVVQ